MDTERANLPSASGLERIALCPGSFALEQTQAPEPESADASSGTRIHAALAAHYDRNQPSQEASLTPAEAETFGMCVTVADLVFASWIDTESGPPAYRLEQREWLLDGNHQPLMSGQYDALLIQGRRALVIDYKTGHGDQAESVANLQLRALAVLVAEAENVDEVTVALIQPWVTMKPQSCVYDKAALATGREQVLAIVEGAWEPLAPRFPGEKQCKFCKARAVCPEANATVTTLATLHTPGIEPVDLLRMLEVVGPAKKVIAALEARAKYLLKADPDALPGWTLSEGKQARTITDPAAAFCHLSDVLTAAEFTACCKVKISELEAAFQTAMKARTGLKPGELKREFGDRLRDCIKKESCAPQLTRAKPALPQAA